MALLFGVVRAAQARGYDTTVVMSGGTGEARDLPDVDGMILVDPAPDDAFVARILASDLPVVSSENTRDGAPTAGTVLGEHEAALTRLLDHLWEVGARHVGMFVTGITTDWGIRLSEGYTRWCAGRGQPALTVAVPGDWKEGDVTSALADLRAREPRLDALVSAPVGASVRVADALRAEGAVIGRDFLVAECEDGPELRAYRPPISALHNRPLEVGARSAELLIDVLEGTRAERSVVTVPVDVLLRSSTGDATRAR